MKQCATCFYSEFDGDEYPCVKCDEHSNRWIAKNIGVFHADAQQRHIDVVNQTGVIAGAGVKYDSGKPQWSLLPFKALTEVVEVLTYGAKKYTTKGVCNCHVSLVKEIVKYGPEDFVNLVTTLKTNREMLMPITNDNENTEKLTGNHSMLVNAHGWLKILMQKNDIDVSLLKEHMDYQTNNLIVYLHNLLVQYVADQKLYALTTTTSPEKLENDFVKAVTLLLDSLRKKAGQIKHSNTCGSMKEISGRDNWKKVPDARRRYIDAGFRHFTAYASGETHDPETGKHHLAHAICCLLYLIAFDLGEHNDKSNSDL